MISPIDSTYSRCNYVLHGWFNYSLKRNYKFCFLPSLKCIHVNGWKSMTKNKRFFLSIDFVADHHVYWPWKVICTHYYGKFKLTETLSCVKHASTSIHSVIRVQKLCSLVPRRGTCMRTLHDRHPAATVNRRYRICHPLATASLKQKLSREFPFSWQLGRSTSENPFSHPKNLRRHYNAIKRIKEFGMTRRRCRRFVSIFPQLKKIHASAQSCTMTNRPYWLETNQWQCTYNNTRVLHTPHHTRY